MYYLEPIQEAKYVGCSKTLSDFRFFTLLAPFYGPHPHGNYEQKSYFFSSFIRSGTVFLQQKYLDMTLLSG